MVGLGIRLAIKWLAMSERLWRESNGPRRDRTAGLVIANDALSQLSYGPFEGIIGGKGKGNQGVLART